MKWPRALLPLLAVVHLAAAQTSRSTIMTGFPNCAVRNDPTNAWSRAFCFYFDDETGLCVKLTLVSGYMHGTDAGIVALQCDRR